MSWRQWLSLVAFGLLLYFTNACTKVNLTCSDIKSADGYRYVTNSTVETLEVEITYHGTIIATALTEQQEFNFTDTMVSKMDNFSVTTHKCLTLQIKLIYKKGKKISDMCEDFIVVEDETPGALKSLSNRKHWSYVAAVAGFIIVVVLLHYCSWKRKRQKAGQDARVPVYAMQLCGGCQCRQGNSVTLEGGQRAAETDNRINNERELEEQLLDGKSPQSNDGKMDVSINMDDIATTNEDKGVPQANGALPHEGQNGNMWHDPGGGKAYTGQQSTENSPNGGSFGEQNSSHDKDKEQNALHRQGSAGRGNDETAAGGGQELVHSLGPDSSDTTQSLQQDGDKGETSEHARDNLNNI